MTLQGNLRSLILAPIESAYMTSYSTSYSTLIVTLVLSCRVSEILEFELLYAGTQIFCIPPLFQQKYRGVPLGVDRDVWVANSKHHRLTNSEIIFEDFQPM